MVSAPPLGEVLLLRVTSDSVMGLSDRRPPDVILALLPLSVAFSRASTALEEFTTPPPTSATLAEIVEATMSMTAPGSLYSPPAETAVLPWMVDWVCVIQPLLSRPPPQVPAVLPRMTVPWM